MLQVQYIIENTEKVIKGLEKRGIIDIRSEIENILSLDEQRRSFQLEADEAAAEANAPRIFDHCGTRFIIP